MPTGKTNPKRKLLSQRNILLILTAIIVAQAAFTGYTWIHQRHINNLYAQEIDGFQQDITSANNGLSYQPITVSPAENKIYLPQLNLSLPVSTLGLSLLYSPDTAYVTGSYTVPTGPLNEAAISTTSTANATQSQTQFNCSSLVRIKFEPKPNPYNPNEIPSGSVSLANGKTLQVYASHVKACQQEWALAQADADAIAALFRQAQSY